MASSPESGIPAGVLTGETVRHAIAELWNGPRTLAPTCDGAVPPGPVGEILREWFHPRPSPPVADWHAASPDRAWEVGAGGWRLVIVSGAIRGIVRKDSRE